MSTSAGYGDDLAYVHDAGFGDFARRASAAIVPWLRRAGIKDGFLVDLGCGTGIFAAKMLRAGYRVLGVDLSEPMLKLARRHAPRAEFVAGSLFAVPLPHCDAVTAIGECLNYTFDPKNSVQTLGRLLRRIYGALRPGGMFVFDVAGPARAGAELSSRFWTEGADWAVLVDRREDRKSRMLARRIVVFRKVGGQYRRSEETHRVRLYRPQEITRELGRAGFAVRVLHGYGKFRLPASHFVIQARKPRR